MPQQSLVKMASGSNRAPPEYTSRALRPGHSFRRHVLEEDCPRKKSVGKQVLLFDILWSRLRKAAFNSP
jgi:hypothetical protein